MRLLLTSSVCWLAVALAAPAQIKVPAPPDTYDAALRYRIYGGRNERVVEYGEMTKYLKGLGFRETETEDSDLAAFDPLAEIIAGTVPSKAARAMLRDPRAQTLILAPAGYKPPDDPKTPVRVLIELSPNREQLNLSNQTEVALGALGFKKDLGFDTRGFTILRGTMPSGNVRKLIHDLRYQPSGWFLPEQAPELFARLPDGTPTPYLVRPFADVLPIRVVEVFGPAEPAPEAVKLPPIPPDQPHLNKWTPDLRRRLAEDGAGTKPLRLEVVLTTAPPQGDLEWRAPFDQAGATVEGRVGSVVTVLVPQGAKAADLAAIPTVSSVRVPRSSAESGPAQPKAEPPKDEGAEKVSPVRFEAEPKPPAPAVDVLKRTGLDRLHALGAQGQGVHVVIVNSDFAGWENHLAPPGKDAKAGQVVFLDLTAERNPDIRPDPMPGTLGHGTRCARAVRLAAPAADLYLVRVPADAPYQIINVARAVRGEEFQTEGQITRRLEINADANAIANRRRDARTEYQRAFADFTDDEAARQRRIAAQRALARLDAEQAALISRQRRLEELERGLSRLAGARVVVCELYWNAGFALDAASPVSRYLDDWLTPRHGGYTRRLTQPSPPQPPLWFQPAGDTRGQTWTGLFRDGDNNGVMEFAPPDVPLKSDRWSRELNFVGLDAGDKTGLDLPAGTKIRVNVQWREPHDPTISEFDYQVPVTPLKLQLVKQRDPSGTKYSSDQIDLIAESEGLPARLEVEPTFGIYEHSLEVTLPADGRYAVRLEGKLPASIRPLNIPTLAGQEVFWELRPRLFVESADRKGRLVLTDFASPAGGVAVPADARSVLAVGAAGPDGKMRPSTARGVGPETDLHGKPDVLAPDTLPAIGVGPAAGSDVAAAFAGGWAASVVSAGVRPNVLRQILQTPGPTLLTIPDAWFRK